MHVNCFGKQCNECLCILNSAEGDIKVLPILLHRAQGHLWAGWKCPKLWLKPAGRPQSTAKLGLWAFLRPHENVCGQANLSVVSFSFFFLLFSTGWRHCREHARRPLFALLGPRGGGVHDSCVLWREKRLSIVTAGRPNPGFCQPAGAGGRSRLRSCRYRRHAGISPLEESFVVCWCKVNWGKCCFTSDSLSQFCTLICSQVWILSGPRVSFFLMWLMRASWMPVQEIYSDIVKTLEPVA